MEKADRYILNLVLTYSHDFNINPKSGGKRFFSANYFSCFLWLDFTLPFGLEVRTCFDWEHRGHEFKPHQKKREQGVI